MGDAARPDDDIVLGFDFGTKRIGVALGNGITRSARPLRIVQGGSAAQWNALSSIIGEWQPRRLVVGVARHPDGAPHEMTARCERFARQLEGRYGLPVARVDERYSSAVLAPGEATDDAAAAVILQQYFDESPLTPAPLPEGEGRTSPSSIRADGKTSPSPLRGEGRVREKRTDDA
jgi:putative holliday junction resolvase